MRIAFMANPDTPNGKYRAIFPMTALSQQGHDVRPIETGPEQSPMAQVRDIDVLHVHRYCDNGARELMLHAQANGAVVVWDDDDDAGSDKGEAHRHENAMVWKRRRQEVDRILGVADLVTAPNAVLVSRFRERGAREVAVLENYIPSLFLKRTSRADDEVTIGWVAALEHQYDAKKLPIQAVLQRLLDERPDLRVVTIGVRLGLQSDRYRHIGGVNFLDRANTVSLRQGSGNVRLMYAEPTGLTSYTSEFDIGIAPLVAAPFNDARSNVKLKEYAAGGTPWLASPVGPYAQMGELQGGCLVEDDRWYEELSRLIDQERDRRELAKLATKWVLGETIEKNAHRWEAALEEAVDRARTA